MERRNFTTKIIDRFLGHKLLPWQKAMEGTMQAFGVDNSKGLPRGVRKSIAILQVEKHITETGKNEFPIGYHSLLSLLGNFGPDVTAELLQDNRVVLESCSFGKHLSEVVQDFEKEAINEGWKQ